MKLADGTPFTIGMTVVFESGRKQPTNDEFQVEKNDCLDIFVLSRKGGFGGIALNLLYPSQEARIKSQVARLEAVKDRIDDEIAYLKYGGNPNDCEHLT